MNYIWCAMVMASLVCGLITGRIEDVTNAAMEGARSSLEVLISFAGAMCMWTGFMRIIEKSGLIMGVCRLFSPLVRLLFPKSTKKARECITMNISANLLGMGNAATPMGINAMKELDSLNKTPDYPSQEMCMLVVINTTSLQLIPSTVIAIRAGLGAVSANGIIVPVWIASAAGFLAAVLAVKLFVHDAKI